MSVLDSPARRAANSAASMANQSGGRTRLALGPLLHRRWPHPAERPRANEPIGPHPAEPTGAGTFRPVLAGGDDKQLHRERVWARLEDAGAARFPGAKGRIPNFDGAAAAAERLT